jgi:4-amino-4-deoxy-L-arabinose transferase-like glycosyltransferase
VKDNIIVKVGMSISYAAVVVLLLLIRISQPDFKPALRLMTQKTGLSEAELVVISIGIVFLLGLIFLYFQSGIYILFLKFFRISKNQRIKVFPAVVLSMCLVGSIFLVASLFVDVTHPAIVLLLPAAILLLNSFLFYMMGKDKKGFSIIFALSIAMYAVNGLLNQI